MAETWITCPLFKQYITVKRRYLRQLEAERWRIIQQTDLWDCIRIAFVEINEPKKEYWIRRLYSYYCERFRHMTKCSWLIFLGELTDAGAYGSYVSDKARRYCCIVRNMAWEMTHHIETGEKACEPVYIFDYIWYDNEKEAS